MSFEHTPSPHHRFLSGMCEETSIEALHLKPLNVIPLSGFTLAYEREVLNHDFIENRFLYVEESPFNLN